VDRRAGCHRHRGGTRCRRARVRRPRPDWRDRQQRRLRPVRRRRGAGDQQILDQINTNLVGPIQVTRAALPHLREQGGGRIIQLSTYGGQATNPGASLYNASKFGVEGFMESLAQELAPFKIGVTIVEPGGASTGFRGRTSQLAEPLAAYNDTPAAMVRGIRDYAHYVGDPAKMADAMIASVDQQPAPAVCCSAATPTSSSTTR
jgi:NAD(P)-dependent dehydrogenase (short-subunit alcohol dehydrogenase family)